MRFALAAAVAVLAHAALLLALQPAETKVVAAIEPVPFDIVLPLPAEAGRGRGAGPETPTRSPPQRRQRVAAKLPNSSSSEPTEIEAPLSGASIAVEPPTPLEQAVAPLPNPLPASAGRGSNEVNALVHARLSAAAERCYPSAAKRFRQRGTVTLTFCGDLDARIVNGAIAQSSGASLLDAAAQNCVLAQASPLPVEAASQCFSVPVRFGAP